MKNRNTIQDGLTNESRKHNSIDKCFIIHMESVLLNKEELLWKSIKYEETDVAAKTADKTKALTTALKEEVAKIVGNWTKD